MRSYIYKVIIFTIAAIIIFEFTVGKYVEKFNKKIDYFATKEGRQKIVNSIKKEMKKANEKENYLDDEEKILIKNFIIKIRKELDLNN